MALVSRDVSPIYLRSNNDGVITSMGVFNNFANAFAIKVLPQPGGP